MVRHQSASWMTSCDRPCSTPLSGGSWTLTFSVSKVGGMDESSTISWRTMPVQYSAMSLRRKQVAYVTQFKEDNLPVDDDIMRATVDASGYLGRAFVEQLKLIGVNQNRVVHAIRNYYRAFEQRSRWMREDLLYVGDLDRYEDRLIEEWDLMFQQMRDELGEDAADEAMTRAAQDLYKWVETGTHHVIRPAVTEPAIARGTYQMLADDLRVGWHLEFRERLQALLAATEASR